MDWLGLQGFDDLHTPLIRTIFQRVPVEGAEQTTFKLTQQRLWVVIVDQLHGLAGLQCFEGCEDEWVAFTGSQSTQVDGGDGSGGGGVHDVTNPQVVGKKEKSEWASAVLAVEAGLQQPGCVNEQVDRKSSGPSRGRNDQGLGQPLRHSQRQQHAHRGSTDHQNVGHHFSA